MFVGYFLFFLLVACFFGGAILMLARWMQRDEDGTTARTGRARPERVVRVVSIDGHRVRRPPAGGSPDRPR